MSKRRAAALLLAATALAALLPTASSLSTAPPPPSATTRREALFRVAAAVGVAVPFVHLEAATRAAATDLSRYVDGPRGLKYIVTEEGTGPKPERAQKIQTSYTLYLNGFPDEDGSAKKVDSSRKPILGEQPFKVRAGVSQVIPGWDLALMDMKEGEGRRLVVPPELGYGDKGVGPIPGKATLFFEMKLTKVEEPEELSSEAKKWLEEHPL